MTDIQKLLVILNTMHTEVERDTTAYSLLVEAYELAKSINVSENISAVSVAMNQLADELNAYEAFDAIEELAMHILELIEQAR